jgi:DNA-binding MarR family transcriptional regulator
MAVTVCYCTVGDPARSTTRHTWRGCTQVSSSTPSTPISGLPIETLILVTGRALRRAYDASLSTLGLSMREGALLRAVYEEGTLTQRQLADRLFIGRAGAGQIIDRVEERGLVRREADPIDRRVWRICLTEAGLALAARFPEAYANIRNELRAGLTLADRDRLEEALSVVRANAERLAEYVDAPEETPPKAVRKSRNNNADRTRTARNGVQPSLND